MHHCTSKSPASTEQHQFPLGRSQQNLQVTTEQRGNCFQRARKKNYTFQKYKQHKWLFFFLLLEDENLIKKECKLSTSLYVNIGVTLHKCSSCMHVHTHLTFLRSEPKQISMTTYSANPRANEHFLTVCSVTTDKWLSLALFSTVHLV